MMWASTEAANKLPLVILPDPPPLRLPDINTLRSPPKHPFLQGDSVSMRIQYEIPIYAANSNFLSPTNEI